MLGALKDNQVGHVNRTHRQGRVDDGKVFNSSVYLHTAGRGHQDLGGGIAQAYCQLRRCEATKHHTVNGAQPSAGQHCNHRFRHHGHVQHDPVPTPYAKFGKPARGATDPIQQVPIADGLAISCHWRIVVNRHLLSASIPYMPVQGIETSVQRAITEPPIITFSIGIDTFFGPLGPFNQPGFVQPELIGLRLRFLVNLVVTQRVTSLHC